MHDPKESVDPNSRTRAIGAGDDLHETWHKAEDEVRKLAAVVELMMSLDHHDNVKDASLEAAHLIREEVDAERVLVFWRYRPAQPIQLIGDTQATSESDDSRLMIAAGEDAVFHGEQFHWERSPKKNSTPFESHPGLLAVKQFAEAYGVQRVIGIPLGHDDNEPTGVILVLDASQESQASWWNLLCEPIATKIASLQALEPTALESRIRAAVRWASIKRPMPVIVMVVAIVVLGCLPFRYRVPAELELQPTLRRFIAVPFDGPLKRAHVRPGDAVKVDELLAEIDPREIEFELAGINAELQRSRQEQKGLLADRDVSGSQLAAWDSKRLEHKSNLLTHKRHNLEIRSPISGIVVNGDWKQSEGMPLTRGETLFEIAPLDQLIVEIAIPEEDIHHVQEGMSVEYVLNSLPGRELHGKILHVHPSAEIRDHENVYLAEAALPNPEGLFRPGMRGHARILSARHSLAWNVLHKPWNAFRRVVGW